MNQKMQVKTTQKTFVIDTNVLLHDPEAILKFARHQVVIPVAVLEELDKMKRLPNELGKNARETIRIMDSLKKVGKGDLHLGVLLENGAKIRIQLEILHETPYRFALTITDNRILLGAGYLKEQGEHVVFVSKDFAARLKAEAMGIEAQDYENLKYSYEGMASGVTQLQVKKEQVDLFYRDGEITIPDLKASHNAYFAMYSPENTPALGKYNAEKKCIQALVKTVPLWGIKPKNMEQRCAVDLLLNDEIQLAMLMGPAGTGKTLLALACGMRKVFDEGVYTKILISRPIVPLGRDIGYLPGTKEEKLFHWMQPIYDNLEYLCASTGGDSSDTLKWVLESKKIETEAVTYIRGRSLPKMYMIIDEAQNLTPHEVKTIISRAAEGTKVILAGDPTQIDNPYLDKDSNGLTFVMGKLGTHPLCGSIFLDKTERSPLAAMAAEVL